MFPARLIKSLTVLALVLTAPAANLRADEPPSDPPQKSDQGDSAPPKVPWIGLAVRAVEPVESTQLDLPPGFGLVVEYIFPDSPADEAGISHHDILRKFDDQSLVNPAQLKTLVCSKAKGDLVKLTILRSGKEIIAEATLDEHQVPAVAAEQPPTATIKDLLAGHGVGIRGVHAKSLDFDNSTASLSDSTGTYTLTKDHKSATLRASKSGKPFFEGPVSTPEQRAALPEEIRKKLETLEAVVGKAKAFTDDAPPRADETKK